MSSLALPPEPFQAARALAFCSAMAASKPVHQRILASEQMRGPHCAAHDAAEDVAPPLVRRQHAVRNEEARCAEMIGDDAMAGLVLAFGLRAGQVLAFADQRLERVRVVI